MAICTECNEKYSDARKELGYDICLNCGEEVAQKQLETKFRSVMPYTNKGGYVYIGQEQVKQKVLGMSGKGIWEL